jgi:tRNA(Ile)-lysidine synthase
MRRPPAVARVLERVTLTARGHDLFRQGQTVLVAVSGGPDSVCLLESLVRLRRTFRIRLEVAHVDHRMRAGSDADAAYVRRAAARLRVPFHLAVIGDVRPPGTSPEAWARGARLRALHEIAREAGAPHIATAHTRDDLAETVLMRMLAGGGAAGVSGIEHRALPFVRPLLDVGRDEVEAFCRSLGLRPRRDPTNEDPTYALRNALRLQGIPALERALGRGVRAPLARSAELLTADDRELTRQMLIAWDDVFDEAPDGADLDAVGLLDLPRVVAARLVQQAIFRCGRVCTRADVDSVLDLARGSPGRRRDLSSGLKARRDRGYVHLSLEPSPGRRSS